MLNNTKGRYWAFVAYPESLPSDWINILQSSGVAFAISPLHDKDLNADLEKKKAHYHIIMCWDGPTTYKNVSRIVCEYLHQPSPIKLECVRGYYRYFCHLDNPEKEPYDVNLIQHFNGFVPEDYDQPSERELDIICKSCLNLIRYNNFCNYREFIDFLDENDLFQEFRFARRNTIFFKEYIYHHK